MRLSGFTFIRNGTKLGYPFIESIRSALPIVDEFVVALGPSEDDTKDRLLALASGEGRGKVRILESAWNTAAPRGFVYAAQSLVALYNCIGDWALYVQGDEALHEDDHAPIRSAIDAANDDPRVEGFAFNYLHFYGSPSTLACSPAWYRREVRVVRNAGLKIVMPSDAQYFTAISGRDRLRYLRCRVTGVRMFHYGWARGPEANRAKHAETRAYYDSSAAGTHYGAIDPKILTPFTGTHPAVMREWLETSASRGFDPDPAYRLTSRDRRQRIKMAVEKATGYDWSKRHYVAVS